MIVLVLLPALKFEFTVTALATSVFITLLKVAGLIGVAAIFGKRVIPAILDRIAATRSRELFTLTVLALAIGLAVGSAALFGVSMALGAFLAGMVVGRSDYSLRAATEALPMRDAFAVLFFVSVGMLLQPSALLEQPAFIVSALLIVLVGNPLTAATVAWLMRYPIRTAVTVAVSLAQIGEFSFILVTLGRDLAIVPAEARRHRRRHGDHLDHAQPAGLPDDRADRSVVGTAAPARPRSTMAVWTSAPRRCSIPMAARSSSATARPAERSRVCCARTGSPRPSWT